MIKHNARMFVATNVLIAAAYWAAAYAWSLDLRYTILLYVPVGLAGRSLASAKWPVVDASKRPANRLLDRWDALLHRASTELAGEMAGNRYLDEARPVDGAPRADASESADADATALESNGSSVGPDLAILHSIMSYLMVYIVLSAIGSIVSESTGISMRIVLPVVAAIVAGTAVWKLTKRHRARRVLGSN